MAYLERAEAGVKLYYQERGEGPALLLINGLSQSAANWTSQVSSLSEGYRVITFDCRGQGRSDLGQEPLDIDVHVSDVLALLDHLGVERVHPVGFSHGARIGLRLAAYHPERVERLVLTGMGADDGVFRRTLVRVWREVLRLGGVEALAWALLAATMTGAPIALYGFSRHFSVTRTVGHFFRLKFDREVLDFAIPQSLNMMLNLGMVRLDSLMLSGFVSANAVGIYSLISDLTQLIRLAKMAFSSVFSPLVARYQAQNNRQGIRDALHTLVRFTSALSIPLLIIMMVMYPHFVLSPDEAWTDGRVFPWLLAIGPMMSCFFGLAGNLLLMTGHARLLLLNSVVCGILNLVLNLLFIPRFGLLGAALATGISNFAISFMQIVEMGYYEKLTMPPRLYAWIMAAAALPLAAAAFVFTDAGQAVVAMLPGQTLFTQSTVYTGLAIAFYVAILFLPPGGFHKAPLEWIRRRKAEAA